METILTPAMEDYLELLLKLQQENRVVRVRDIAQGMSVTMPSVTSMLNTLAKNDLINHEKYEYVELTPRGLGVAQDATRKHTVLFRFLKDILKVDPQQADNEACRMEHAITESTLSKLLEFLEFCETCPVAGRSWLEYFRRHCRTGAFPEKCRAHMTGVLEETIPAKKSKLAPKGARNGSSRRRRRPSRTR